MRGSRSESSKDAVVVKTMAEVMQALDDGHRAAAIADLDEKEYHNHSGFIGSSDIEDYRKSRILYKTKKLDRTVDEPEPTSSILLGTLIHLLVFEPEKYADKVAPPYPEKSPDGKKWLRRKGSDHERWWREEELKRAGMLKVTEDMQATANRVASSVKNHSIAKRLLLAEGVNEFSVFWIDELTGLGMKCRIDRYSDLSIDLKTTDSISPNKFIRKAVNIGYHRKIAHYKAGLQAFTGEPAKFVYIAAETVQPHRVAVYDIVDCGNDGDSLGEMQRRDTLREIAKSIDNNDWQEEYEKQITSIEIPNYAWTENNYKVENETDE